MAPAYAVAPSLKTAIALGHIWAAATVVAPVTGILAAPRFLAPPLIGSVIGILSQALPLPSCFAYPLAGFVATVRLPAR